MSRVVIPFAAGVAVGVALHKYWPQIREAARGNRLFDRARTRFWEQSEKFADLVAEIREEEELAREGARAEPA